MKAFDSILSSPDWFLASFDPDGGRFAFFKTNRQKLDGAAFHDGRTELSINSELVYVSLDEAISWRDNQGSLFTPHRIIAHISFCASNLLARSLELGGRSLSYREPQVLIDLANIKAARNTLTEQNAVWQSVLQFAFGQFQKCSVEQDAAFVKPSNWVNNILPDLAIDSERARFVLMDMDIESYLIANIRGGKSRIGYSLELLNHLVSERPKYQSMIVTVEKMPITPMRRALYLLVICFEIQMTLLAIIERETRAQHVFRLSRIDFLTSPEQSLLSASRTLDLPIPSADSAPDRIELFNSHAKLDEKKVFSSIYEESQNARIKSEFQVDISSACEWHHHFF